MLAYSTPFSTALVGGTILALAVSMAAGAKVRPSAIAGQWYTSDPKALAAELDGYLSKVPEAEGATPLGIIVPHAGFMYSGQCAAHGFKRLAGSDYKRVVILAPSHHAAFSGASIADADAYETPLGQVMLDRKACDKLLESPLVSSKPGVHRHEHSLEIELPFLQRVLAEGFTIVPLVIGQIDRKTAGELGALIAPLLDDDTVLVTSSDFTHYGHRFGYLPFSTDVDENLRKLDGGAIEHIVGLDIDGFMAYCDETGATICGQRPIAVAMAAIAAKGATGQLLNYDSSGRVTGDWGDCVQYAAIGFFPSGERTESPEAEESETGEESVTTTPPPSPAGPDEPPHLTVAEQKTLLSLARDTLEMHLREKRRPDPADYDVTDTLREMRGVFVTLEQNGRLRGCIGYIEGRVPVFEGIIENAVNAATRDPRFPPMSADEIDKTDIEISVMTPLRLIDDPSIVTPGRHGLYIRKGFNSGLLLPQVAVEWGWGRVEFLEQTCRKAGLPRDAWKEGAEIYTFEAQVFGEHE